MIYKEHDEQYVRRMVEGLGHPHLKGLLKCWNIFKADTIDEHTWGILYDYFAMYDEPAPGVRHLRVQAWGKEPIHSWMDMQEIKNLLWGNETVAVEIYPAASQFKDGSNTYHLWTWPGLAEVAPNLLTLYTYAQ